MKHFIQTIRFSPNNFELLGFKKLGNGIYLWPEDKSVWKERKLLDLGYGRENGLVRQPELQFEQLLALVFDKNVNNSKDGTYNYWGSLATLIDDYPDDFLNYLVQKYNVECLKKEYPHIYNYLDAEYNYDDSFIRRISSERVKNCCHIWKKYVE